MSTITKPADSGINSILAFDMGNPPKWFFDASIHKVSWVVNATERVVRAAGH
jgi:hypothetical protein